MPGADKLFHTIVVVGASLGCGGASGAVDDGGAVAPVRPDCDAASLSICDGAICKCAPKPPSGICDCARPGEFRCNACPIGDPPVDGRCLSGDGSGAGTGCFCDSAVAVAGPGDCASPEQFSCVTFFGPTAYAHCSCDVTAPMSSTDCSMGTTFQCLGANTCPAPNASEGGIIVGAESPRFACFCGPPPVPIL